MKLLPDGQAAVGKRIIDRFDSALKRVNGAVIALMLAVMLTLVFGNVIGRFFFSTSFGWAEEVTRYLMIWVVFLGAGLGLREGVHVAVTLFVDLSRTLKPAITWLSFAFLLSFFAALAWFGFEYAMFASRQRSAMLQLPMWIVYLSVPIGASLAVIHLLLSLRDPVDGETPEVETPQ